MQDAVTVLIVEDDPLFIKLMTTMLRTESFAVHGAASAEEAIELLKTKRFDVVITDLRMDGMGGAGLIRWIQSEKAFRIDRILVTTGEPANGDDVAWVRCQNIPILNKPFAMRALLDAVRRLTAG